MGDRDGLGNVECRKRGDQYTLEGKGVSVNTFPAHVLQGLGGSVHLTRLWVACRARRKGDERDLLLVLAFLQTPFLERRGCR